MQRIDAAPIPRGGKHRKKVLRKNLFQAVFAALQAHVSQAQFRELWGTAGRFLRFFDALVARAAALELPIGAAALVDLEMNDRLHQHEGIDLHLVKKTKQKRQDLELYPELLQGDHFRLARLGRVREGNVTSLELETRQERQLEVACNYKLASRGVLRRLCNLILVGFDGNNHGCHEGRGDHHRQKKHHDYGEADQEFLHWTVLSLRTTIDSPKSERHLDRSSLFPQEPRRRARGVTTQAQMI